MCTAGRGLVRVRVATAGCLSLVPVPIGRSDVEVPLQRLKDIKRSPCHSAAPIRRGTGGSRRHGSSGRWCVGYGRYAVHHDVVQACLWYAELYLQLAVCAGGAVSHAQYPRQEIQRPCGHAHVAKPQTPCNLQTAQPNPTQKSPFRSLGCSMPTVCLGTCIGPRPTPSPRSH